MGETEAILVQKDPELLDSYLEEVLQFSEDPSAAIRVRTLRFVEEACAVEIELLPKMAPHLLQLMADPVLMVLKRAIATATKLFRPAFRIVAANANRDTDVRASAAPPAPPAHGLTARWARHSSGIRCSS